MEGRLCALQYAAGRVEPCRTVCPFWESGGAVVDRGCMLERLLPVDHWTPELAARWLRVRSVLVDRIGRPRPERDLFQLLGATPYGDDD